MPIFERPPLDTLAPAKDRFTPIYLEHGRLEVDDSSFKWIGKEGLSRRSLFALARRNGLRDASQTPTRRVGRQGPFSERSGE